MAGGLEPWTIYWTRLWEEGRELEAGPKGRLWIWLNLGQFEPPGGGEEVGSDDEWEGPY